MNSIQIGSAANAPCSAPPSDLRLSSKPSHTPTVMSGSKPTNHASVLSSTVPVLPASGHWRGHRRRLAPVPRRLSTPRSMLVITNAVSARITSVGSPRFSSSRLPSRSFTFSTANGFIRTP